MSVSSGDQESTLLLHLLARMENEIVSLRAALSDLPSPDAIRVIRQDIDRLSRDIKDIRRQIDDERREGAVSRAKIAVYAGLFLMVAAAILGMIRDWLPRIFMGGMSG